MMEHARAAKADAVLMEGCRWQAPVTRVDKRMRAEAQTVALAVTEAAVCHRSEATSVRTAAAISD